MKPGAKPFEGAACEFRLKEWIGRLGVLDYRIINQSSFTITQLYSLWYKSGDLYGTPQVHYIALGNNASKALKNIPHFKLPHPSFRNRILNNTCVITDRLLQCKEHIRKIYENENRLGGT